MSRHLLALAFIAGCAPGEEPGTPALEAAQDPALQRDALVANLEDLYDIAMEHNGNRALGTPGFEASVAWAEQRFEELGLEVRREPFDVSDFDIEDATLRSDGSRYRDFTVMTWSGDGSATGDIVAVDATIPPASTANSSTSGCEASDFADFPAGSIALIQRGSCTFADKVALAEAAGAIAVILFNEGQDGRRTAVQGTLDESAPPSIPVVGVGYTDGVDLEGTRGEVTVLTDITRVPSFNVIAELPGDSGDRWIIGAHLDSVPAGPGINDNGTGVSTVIQIAERLAATRPAHGVRFALWGAEEVGLVGSLAHASAIEAMGMDGVLGNLNFDMVGSPNPGRFIYDGDGSDYPPSLDLHPDSSMIEAAFTRHFDELGLSHAPIPFEGRSDYVGFAYLGLPVGGTFTGAETAPTSGDVDAFGVDGSTAFDSCYHRSCDTIDNIDADVLEQMAGAASAVLEKLIEADDSSSMRRVPAHVTTQALPIRSHGGCSALHGDLPLDR